MQAELADRFGVLPPEVTGLLYQIRVKLRAQRANITTITCDDTQISLRLPYLAEVIDLRCKPIWGTKCA